MAVVASGRVGNVASEMIDERDVCRRCGVNETLVGDRTSKNFLFRPPAPELEEGPI